MRKIDLLFLLIAAGIIGIFYSTRMEKPMYLDIQHIHLDSISQIINIDDSLVVPALYDTLIVDQLASIADKKLQFINQVLPAILIVRFQMEKKSRKIKRIIKHIEEGKQLNRKEEAFADSLMERFRAKSYENLLVRLKPHQTSLVLAQAAAESGWGSSRFAIEGNNLFGVWSTKNDPSVIKSLYDRSEQQIYVKKYHTVAESIDHYFLTIGRHKAYRKFRTERYGEKDVFNLIEMLNNYSEDGQEYIDLLKKIIKWNDLQKYDSYKIDPNYLIEEDLLKILLDKFNL